MRLVTSCPACKTLFHVQQEQLSPHQTEVRCGQCRQVFSIAPRLYALLQPQSLLPEAEQEHVYPERSSAPTSYDSAPAKDTDYNLQEHSNPSELPPVEDQALPNTPVEEVPVEEVPVEEVPVEEVPVEEVPVEEAPVEEIPIEEIPIEEVPIEEAPVEEAPVEEVPVEAVPVEEVPVEEVPVEAVPVEEIPPLEPITVDLKPEVLLPVSDDSTPSAGNSHAGVTDDQPLIANPAAIPRQRTETLEVLLQPPRPQVESEPVETSFLADREGLHTPLLPRWLAIILAVLLSLGAVAQSSYFFRTEIASHWPASKPWLVSACTWLGCSVPLARHAELLALDDSDLQENLEHPEVIQLSTTLINNASYTQAYPLLELTLTDDDDQPRLRRIFTPKEYLRAETDIEAGLPANEEIQIKLSLSTSDVTVSGYRVFVTY